MLARTNCIMTWTQLPTLPRFVGNNAGVKLECVLKKKKLLYSLFCSAACSASILISYVSAACGALANDILACKRFSCLTAVLPFQIKMFVGEPIILKMSQSHSRWSNHIQLLSSTSLTIVLFQHIGNTVLEWNIRQWGSSPPSSPPMIHRLASSFPCLVELGIGQNMLLTDSSLSSVARSSWSFDSVVI